MSGRNVFAMTLLLIVSIQQAQANEPSFNGELGDEVRKAPQLDVSTGFAGSGFELFANGDSSSVALAVGRNWDANTNTSLNTNGLSLKLTTPLNKTTKIGDFVTQTGLSNSTALQISFTRLSLNNPALPATVERRRELRAKGIAACKDAQQTEAAKKACETLDTDVLWRRGHLSASEYNEIRDSVYNTTDVWYYGVSGEIGYKEHKYRDESDFSKQSDTKTPFGFAAFVGLNPNDSPFYVGTGVEYKVEYKDAESRTLCMPPPTSGPQECFTSSFMAPVRDKDLTVFALARYQWELGFGTSRAIPMGIELKAAYDFEDDTFGISVPLYLFSDKEGNLRGGVRVSWEDDNNDLSAGVFVGSSFSLF